MDDRLLHLLDAYLENRLTDSEAGELRDVLRAAPEVRRTFWEYVEQHALIEDLLGESRGRDLALIEQDGLSTPAADEVLSSSGRRSSPGGGRRHFPALGWGLAVLAASFLLAAGWLQWLAPGSPTLGEADNAQLVEMAGSAEVITPAGVASPVRVGQQIGAGQSIRTGEDESSAVIEYPDRTRLKLGAGTTVTLSKNTAGSKRVSFTGGSLLADVPPQPDGFPMIVTGPQGEVRVSDTCFLLASAASDSSRLDLTKGQGQMFTSRGRPVVLDAGHVALVSPQGGEVVVRPMPVMSTRPRTEVNLQGLQSVAFSADGKTVLAATSYQAVLWDGEGRLETLPLFEKRKDGWRSSWSPDGTVLAVWKQRTRQMILWDLAQRRVRRTIDIPDGLPNEFLLAPQGRWFAALDPKERATRLRVWDGVTGTERAVPRLEPTIGAFASSADGRWLAVGRGDKGTNDKNSVLLLDAVTGKPEASLPVRFKATGGMAFSADGRFLALGSAGQIQIWDLAAQKHLLTIRGHERHVRVLVFSPDGKLLAGATHEGPVWCWSTANGEEVAILDVPLPGVQALAFAPDGRTLATVQAKGTVLQLWDIPINP